jgi:5-methylcytosine-specific restriction endonuclease McrA
MEHGARSGYRHGCRCDACVRWNRTQNAAYRQKRRDEGRPIKKFGSSGPWIAPSVREAVFERDKFVCQLCLEPVQPEADPQSDWYPSLDHIVPQSLGGGHGIDNLRLAHRWCNAIRGARDYHSDLFVEAS